jgi:hypothetical protein
MKEDNVTYLEMARIAMATVPDTIAEQMDMSDDEFVRLEDKTITLNKHEVVLDRDFVEEVWELAFGHDAWNKGFNDQEVLDKLKQYEAHALKWEEQEGLL